MVALPFILLPIFFCITIRVFYLFDTFIKHEHQYYHDKWVADGKPHGFFWTAPDGNSIESYWARNKVSTLWMKSYPDWIKESPELLSKYRQILYLTRAGIGLWIMLAILLLSQVAGSEFLGKE